MWFIFWYTNHYRVHLLFSGGVLQFLYSLHDLLFSRHLDVLEKCSNIVVFIWKLYLHINLKHYPESEIKMSTKLNKTDEKKNTKMKYLTSGLTTLWWSVLTENTASVPAAQLTMSWCNGNQINFPPEIAISWARQEWCIELDIHFP